MRPSFEVLLPHDLAIILEPLYSKVEFERMGQGLRGSQGEFPVMLRYRFGAGNANPFVAGGGLELT